MYACLYSADQASAAQLQEIARRFSPHVEQTSETTAVFSITPLRKLIGSPYEIASEISRAGYESKLQANLAIASNPDSAILLARHFSGVTLVTPGEERLKLGSLPLPALFSVSSAVDPTLLDVLHRWGLKTVEELALLPERGVAERLGESGIYLQNLARGAINRPLHVTTAAINYEEHLELEHRLELLEPLLFLFGRALGELCRRLRSQSRATRTVAVRLDLEDHEPYNCELEFPVPLDDSRTILKLLQLHLERHSPPAPIIAFTLRAEPVAPRHIQGGMFLPPAPTVEKLHITLARIAGMVGEQNVGTPALLNTHREDAFEMKPLPDMNPSQEPVRSPQILHLGVRLFRPALPARVRLVEYAPQIVLAVGVKGKVLQHAGPWKTSGEWWAPTFWCREEWDVALDDGALYRIYQDSQSGDWYVHGAYD
jgi:protein ImuB